ncbi:MAG TPA: histidine kinase [Steroidobacteraceae bacterium]|nr:histidine kinase [Steroidobacteraceae bacterium]
MASTSKILAWPRLRFTWSVSAAFGVVMGLANGGQTALPADVFRALFVGTAILLMFGWLERWPRRMPKWLPRTVLRLIGIVVIIPIATKIAFNITGGGRDHDVHMLLGVAVLFAPWIAIGTILRQRDAFAREQALEFELQRSEFERRESDARLRLLQAQVEPHFLFNTLANVQELVDSGSPQASKVLSNLIAYLRAAVPRMHSQTTTLENEVDLARSYLELMQMRMPDRLQYAIHLDPAAVRLQCPPMTLLTLVENSVRHGIDPSEAGGRIDADIWIRDDRCVVRVKDTGVGLKTVSRGLGTGLSTLRERLKLAFGGDAQLTLTEIAPHGVCAELSIPMRAVPS